jgi:drug/metabolite transporter (DMT)-like permease
MSLPYRGEILSIISAIAWATAVILFRISGRKVAPLALNLFKSTLASLLLGLTAWLLAPAESPQEVRLWGLLIVSGFFGIALSDTLFFVGLNKLGASLTAIVECLYSPFVISLSLIFLGETMKLRQIFGVSLILVAVMTIAWRGNEKRNSQQLITGIVAGTGAMFFMALGIVMIKPLLAEVSILWAAGVRMASGAIFLGLAMLFYPQRKRIMKPLLLIDNRGVMIIASLVGAYGGIIAWVAGMKFTAASIAAPLNQLSTVFIFIFAVIFLKEKLTWVRFLALIAAFAGAFLASWA